MLFDIQNISLTNQSVKKNLRKFTPLNTHLTDLLLVDRQVISVPVSAYPPTVSAKSINDYKFICWIDVASSGFVGSPYLEDCTQTTTNIFDYNKLTAGTLTYVVFALYQRK